MKHLLSSESLTLALTELIKQEVDREIKALLEEQVIVVQKKIERNIKELVGRISVRVLEKVSFERLGHEILIHVSTENYKAKQEREVT